VIEFREDSWADIGDSDALRYELIKGRQVADDLSINISKMSSDCLAIEIYNHKFTQDMLSSSRKYVTEGGPAKKLN